MPELPEVEITRRGLEASAAGGRIRRVVVRNPSLRQPVPADLPQILAGRRIDSIVRRAKYLLLGCGDGHLVIHLGMSGSLRTLAGPTLPGKHDHVDLELDSGRVIRYTDPRRFGLMLWTVAPPEEHPLLRHLGHEPLEEAFDGPWLYAATRARRTPIKVFLMNGQWVTGIGNIYANEALYRARIHPSTPASRVGLERSGRLVRAVKRTLRLALRAGGSSLRDFVGNDGAEGHFQMLYRVYGRAGEPCRRCGQPIRGTRHAQRATFYCSQCQR